MALNCSALAVHWQTNLMTFIFILVTLLATTGLVRRGLVKVWDCCVVGMSCRNAWLLHTQALLLLVLLLKSIKSSASSDREGFSSAALPYLVSYYLYLVLVPGASSW